MSAISLNYILRRALFAFLHLFIGVNVIFVILRLAPLASVEIRLQQAFLVGSLRYPEEAESLRNAWLNFYGLKGDLLGHYAEIWRRLITFDFGPSLVSFPTSVSTLILRALPWTIGLLTLSILISWLLGTSLGIISGSLPSRRLSKLLTALSLTLYPIPYYLLGLVLIFIFAYLVPLFPLGGGVSVVPPHFTGSLSHDLALLFNILHHASLPALSLVVPASLGWFFLSAYSITRVKMGEEHIVFSRLLGLREGDIRRHLWGEANLAQVTLLTLQLGQILGGALITEILFTYPGMGYLIYRAITVFDYNLLAAVALLSCVVIAAGVFVLDVLAPLIDPRVQQK
ncbi:MAG: ABC transporter permease [Nitrososphaerota archaeon]|nr:ABC transporter permease [Candidatus Calditenuaceae archaeon]MDW8072635.1 ABC transporter permease [Nitrososphaerota archaeon]